MRLGFQSKLFCMTIAVVVLTIVILTLMQAHMARQGYRDKGRLGLAGVSDTLGQALRLQNSQSLRKLHADLDTLTAQFNLKGFPVPEMLMDVELPLIGADGTAGDAVTIPAFKHGGHYLHENTELVDAVAVETGAVTSVLQLDHDRLIRISTSLKDKVAGWGRGSWLGRDDARYETLLQGKPVEGRVRFGGTWYQVRLTPVRDLADQVIGALEVARPLISADFATFVCSVQVSEGGGSFAVDGDGQVVIAGPEGVAAADFGDIGMLSGRGALDVTLPDGRLVEVVVRHFEPWDMYFVTWVADADLMRGVSGQLARVALLSGGLALLLALIVVGFTGRRLMEPVRRLATMAERVAAGDFSFDVRYTADDALGQTIGALQSMVRDLKHKLGFGKGVLEGVVVPCVIVDAGNRISHVNQAALEILGHEGVSTDYQGRTLNEFAYGDATRRTLTERVMESGRQLEQEIQLFNRKQGREVYLRVVATPIHDLDESLIGVMALWVDLTEEKIRQRHIEAQHQAMTEAAHGAEAVSRKVTAAAADLAGRIETSSHGAELQQAQATQAAQAMERMNVSLGQVDQHAQSSSELARQAVAQAEQGNRVVRDSMAVMNRAVAQTTTLRADLTRLGATATSIGAIMDMVGDIADQTNLLALNAAIEAARAGNAGRGFAVVADEVRKLAEKTMDATRQVETSVRDIQKQVGTSIRMAEETSSSMTACSGLVDESGVALTSIVETIGSTAGRIHEIAEAVALQRRSGESVMLATDEMATIARNNARAMDDSTRAIQGVNDLAREMLEAIAFMRMGAGDGRGGEAAPASGHLSKLLPATALSRTGSLRASAA